MRAINRREFALSGLACGLFSGTAFAEGTLPRIIRPSSDLSHVRTPPAPSLYEMELGPSALDPEQLPAP